MATYYVRMTGNDANAGTSAGASWRTFAKLLGAAGMASGDTCWVGSGVYREVVTVNMTSAVAETKIYGDVTGANTGDVGEVQWSSYVTNDITGSSSSSILTLNGRDFLTFQDIVFQFGAANAILATTNTSTDIKFIRCAFIQGGTGVNVSFNITSAANVALNWVIDSCLFTKGQQACIFYTPVRPATADFDVNFIIKNCLFIGGAGGSTGSVIAGATPSGANTFNPGGILIYNCTNIAGGVFITLTTLYSTTIPCTVYNCFHFTGGNALAAGTSGQIIEDYNIIIGGASPRTNVTAGTHSRSDGSIAPLFFTGHEYWSVGSNLTPFGMPKPGSPLLGFGNQAGSPTTDILGAAKPSGFVKLFTGTATSGGAATITNSGATFGTNALVGTTIKIISGTGSGQTKTIRSNTATAITVDGNWKTQPDNTTVYEVYLRATSSTGTATAGTTTTLTDSGAAWGVNSWAGFTLTIDTGTGNGQTLLVVSNTATVLTFATATAPDNTSTYSLFRGASVNVINAGVGCYENSNSAVPETVTVRTGSDSWCIPGAGYYDYEIIADAVSTTISVYVRYDSAYSGTLPSMNLINGGQAGVANASVTAVGSANTWELLQLTFTPTSKGQVTVRIISSTTTPTGNMFIDDFDFS